MIGFLDPRVFQLRPADDFIRQQRAHQFACQGKQEDPVADHSEQLAPKDGAAGEVSEREGKGAGTPTITTHHHHHHRK